MTERQKQLYDLIKQYPFITLKELSILMNLSEKQTYQRILKLDDLGYRLLRKYYETGDIAYALAGKYSKFNQLHIYTDPNNKFYRAIFLGDTHLMHETENKKVLKSAFAYARQYNIHNIFHLGDMFVQTDLKSSFDEIVNYTIKNYPYDKNITTFFVPGNHEYDCLKNSSLNIKSFLKRKRYDIVSLNYQNTRVFLKNDFITIRHPINGLQEKKNNGICFTGHHHNNNIMENDDTLMINVPACSNANLKSLPGILDVNFEFNEDGLINGISSSTLVYHEKLIKVSNFSKSFTPYREKSKDRENLEVPKIYTKKGFIEI